jgi:NAD+ synthase
MKLNVALVSLDPTVGALSSNADLIVNAYREAVAQGADVVVTPEMGLSGYPLQDLTQKVAFLHDVEVMRRDVIARIKAMGHDAAIVFGHPTDSGRHDGNRRLVYNSATFLDPARGIVNTTHKVELPNYGVFDEKRNYAEAPMPPSVVEYRGIRLGVMICEDGWFPGVTKSLAAQGADILLWINGSPYSTAKNVKRRLHASNRIKDARVPIAYVNLVGGQDELVFDGDCFAWDGSSYVETELFRETVQVVSFDIERGQAWRDSDTIGPVPQVNPTGVGENYRAKVLGFKDYLRKTGFTSVVIGMSGGIDSAIAASICVDAIGPENVHLVRLPSGFSSSGSLDDAMEARNLLGCPMRTIPIEAGVEAARRGYADAQWDTPRPADAPGTLSGIADENIQARQRAQHLMSISNMENRMLVTTGNKSEVSTGFSTIGGDMMGGYNVLKDLLKTEINVAADRPAADQAAVDRLCEVFGAGIVQWRNSLTAEDVARFGYQGPSGTTVPLSIQIKAASAELAEGQVDSNSLPFYPVLDGILKCLINHNMGVEATIASDMSDPVMLRILEDARLTEDEPVKPFTRREVEQTNRRINASEYKRRQAAPGPKISDMHHGSERRVPIVMAYAG